MSTTTDKIAARISEIMAMKQGRPTKNAIEHDPHFGNDFKPPPLSMGSDRPVYPGSAGGLSLDVLKELRLLMIGMNKEADPAYQEWVVKVYNL